MNDEVKQRLQSTETWVRVLFMLLFIFVQSGVKFMIILLAMFQFGATILAGKTNMLLLKLGHQLAMYDYQINVFMTFNTEQRPFPFSSWPVANDEFFDTKPAETRSAETKPTETKSADIRPVDTKPAEVNNQKSEENQGNTSWFQ